jgi:serine protease AprX
MALAIRTRRPHALSRTVAVAGVVALCAAVSLVSVPTRVVAGAEQMLRVIVQEVTGSGSAAESAVSAVGGSVERRLDLIDSFTASIPAGRVPSLRAARGVRTVTPDASVQLLSSSWSRGKDGDAAGARSMDNVIESINADDMWALGHTGAGVDVALIDSGVAPVNGLTTRGKVINGADLSFDSQRPGAMYLDAYGHGTHMAGIIAGLDNGHTASDPYGSSGSGRSDGRFAGVAPGARILNVKVGSSDGAADVSQVIAAIDWVVEHKNDRGMNIRVLNLSFGTSGTQSYLLDPLAHAAEVAWHNGIVVVVAGGNDGFGSEKLNNPAYDPYVIAVSATDTQGTDQVNDDTVSPFSSTGDAARRPDFAAPGTSVASLRVPGSFLDTSYATARDGTRLFRGSGTSQAAAVVSGAVALMLQARPGLTPDHVKYMLAASAKRLERGNGIAEGAGTIDVAKAIKVVSDGSHVQSHPRSRGTGSLESARGLSRVAMDGLELRGEIDIFGVAWDGDTWASRCLDGAAWSGSDWRGSSWTGSSWTGSSWTGSSWTGSSWTGSSWTGSSWTGSSWTGSSWTGSSWTGSSWTGSSWTGSSWTGSSWTGSSWTAAGWGA